MIKKIVGLFIIVAFVGLSVLALTPTPSYALPNFAKKHEASCTLCHTVWPALNRFGEQYFINGFQMPDTEDGGDVGKIKPDEHVSLDTGSANPPLSVRMVIETTLSQDTATEGATTDSRPSLITVKKFETPFFLGGTLGKNLSYFVDNATGTQEQAWVGIHNLGGPGTANIRYGVLNMADFDAFSEHRHDLGGFLNEASGSSPAADSHTDAVALQVYGRPGAGPLTYQVSFDTGNPLTAKRIRGGSNSLNLGLMARGDFGPLAVSLHYVGMSDKASFASGAKDKSSTTTTLAARAIMTGYEVSFAYAMNSTDPGTGTKADMSGMVIEGIYFTEVYDVQARLSTASVDKASTQDTSQIALKFDYHATTNSKIFFKFVSDSKKADYLKVTDIDSITPGTQTDYNDGYISIGTDWAF